MLEDVWAVAEQTTCGQFHQEFLTLFLLQHVNGIMPTWHSIIHQLCYFSFLFFKDTKTQFGSQVTCK